MTGLLFRFRFQKWFAVRSLKPYVLTISWYIVAPHKVACRGKVMNTMQAGWLFWYCHYRRLFMIYTGKAYNFDV